MYQNIECQTDEEFYQFAIQYVANSPEVELISSLDAKGKPLEQGRLLWLESLCASSGKVPLTLYYSYAIDYNITYSIGTGLTLYLPKDPFNSESIDFIN